MKDGTYIMMSVRCIGNVCKNCRNLSVDSDVKELYGDGELVSTEVELHCRGVSRCMRIKKMIESDIEKQFDVSIDYDERTSSYP